MDHDLLKKICDTPGVSGFEDPVQDVVTKELETCCDEVRRDRLTNVIGFKKATNPPTGADRPMRVMLAAHSDEVGLMVKHISDKGFVRVIQLGGINPEVISSQRMTIHGKQKVSAIVVPSKGGKGNDKKPTLDEMRLDLGMSGEEARKLITPGDVVTFDVGLEKLNDKVYVGRNFDDRMGTYCLVQTMKELGETAVDTYGVSTVQEEVGLRGARVAAFSVAPDIGIALDGSMTSGAHVGEEQNLCGLDGGTGIYLHDGLTIGHRKLCQCLIDTCEDNNIPYQRNIGGGTDAAAIQQSRGGVCATTVGAPVRYMHSTVQLCSSADMDATVAMLKAFIESAHERAADWV